MYNLSLDYKKTLYSKYDLAIKKGDVQKELADIAGDTDWIGRVHSQTLQDVTDRLYLAYDKYFRDLKSGEIDRLKAAYVAKCQRKGRTVNPVKLTRMGQVNFARKGEYNSFAFKQGVKLTDRYVQLPKFGKVRYRNSQPCNGTIKRATVVQCADGWYVCLCVETDIQPLAPVSGSIGIDCGIKSLIVTSAGESIENPKHLYKAERKLKRLQRGVSRKKKGSNNRRKAVQKLARQHQRVANTRKDFQHKLTTRLIRKNQSISVEDLAIKNMLANHHLAKSISDAGWYQLTQMLDYKAKWYGRSFEKVSARHTSQDCSVCGYRNTKLTLAVRSWTCPSCGTVHDRDVNAAQNIKHKSVGHTRLACEIGSPMRYAPVGVVAEESPCL